jgi:hypothetical protein
MTLDKQTRRTAKPRAAFVAGLAAVALLSIGSLARAQDNSQSPRQAPSAFRVQPRLSDLPPGVAQTETRRTEAQKAFDKKLWFCRNC